MPDLAVTKSKKGLAMRHGPGDQMNCTMEQIKYDRICTTEPMKHDCLSVNCVEVEIEIGVEAIDVEALGSFCEKRL
jgi:hypothetical protein